MDMPQWSRADGEYVITLSQGKALVIEDVASGRMLYKPHIEENSGSVITRFEPGFEDFETADAFIRANLIELDRLGLDEAAFRHKLADTLENCINLMPQPSRIFHRLRLENIKRWLLRPFDKVDRPNLPRTDWTKYTFEWQQNERQFQCETIHGKVLITESSSQANTGFRFGSAPTYTIQIVDVTGVILKDYYVPSRDFLSAESRVREILSELEQPFVDEVYLDQLSLTLQICQHLLPTDTDPMHFIRLGYIENYLGEALP